jgi:general secretion pathway protein E
METKTATLRPEPPESPESIVQIDLHVEESVRADPTDGSSPQVEAAVDVRKMAADFGLERIDDLSSRAPSAKFIEHIPIQFARRHFVLGLESENGTLPLAVTSLDCLDVLDVLARYLACDVEPMLAEPDAIQRAINRAYEQRSGEADQLIESMDRDEVLRELNEFSGGSGGGGREDLLETDSRSPVIKLVNVMLFEAVKIGASDVHLQPYEDSLVVRMRIDGVLFDMYTVPKHLQESAASRVKIIGHMNIAEKRLAQDGRATVQVGDRVVDLRISAVPTSHGERIVIRLLDKSARLYTLEEIGMAPGTLALFRQLIRVEHGLLLLTGPTGSGKSTTLYAGLQEINAKERNIITLEDPIEYQIPGVSQIQVSTKKGMTFASGLRSVLRQDPDIIMVGEIRDSDTAVMAIQSALTGHLVCSTLHTNDSASAVTRLLDLGIEPYLAASSVIGVMAQRLVRRVCRHCAQSHASSPEELASVGIESADNFDTSRMVRGTGCSQCRNTGYAGRVGLFELLIVDNRIRNHIQHCDPAASIKATALERGMTTLRDDGLSKVSSGMTTIEEVVRVTMRATV